MYNIPASPRSCVIVLLVSRQMAFLLTHFACGFVMLIILVSAFPKSLSLRHFAVWEDQARGERKSKTVKMMASNYVAGASYFSLDVDPAFSA